MRSIKAIFVTLVVLFGSFVLSLAQPDTDIILGLEQGKPADAPSSLINATSYPFSASSGVALEDMSSGTTELIAAGADNENSGVANIGFIFRFDGGLYTTFGANANGLIKLGGVVSGPNSTNSIDSTNETPKIAPLWDDLCVGSGGRVHYKTIGTGIAHKLVVEWTNMKISRGGGCDGSGSGRFQLWLYERSGIVQFVYGSGVTPTATDGYSIGMQFTSGFFNNYVSVISATNTVVYGAPANNSQVDPIASGTSYVFTPRIPTAPSGGYATVSLTTATLNWIDNASNETGYLVVRTTDQINYFFIGYLAPNAVTFPDSGLTPGTQYFYYVYALSEGAFSDELAIPVTTSSTTSTISSTTTGGNWSAPSTWAGGVVPTGADDVVIVPGATVTIDTASAQAANVTLGTAASLTGQKELVPEGGSPARLTFEETEARKLTILNHLTIEANGNFSTGGGTVADHTVEVRGNLINKGMLDLSTNGGSSAAAIDFKGDTSATFAGTGAVTDISRIRMNKAALNNIVELAPSNFTVNGTTTDGPGSGFLLQNGGTFKISGTFTGAYRTFWVDNYWPPATSGFWLNNPNYTVTASGQSGILTGGLRMTAGEFNKGLSVENNLTVGVSFIMEGGRLNVSGSLWISSGTRNISGGKITVCRSTGGSCTLALEGPSPGLGSFTMSGGEIVVQNSANIYADGSASNPPTFTGGLLRIGSELSVGPGTYDISGFTDIINPPHGYLPNTLVDTSSGFTQTVFRNLQQPLHVMNLTIGTGGIFKARSLSIHGTSFINNGQLEIVETFPTNVLEFDDRTGLSDITYSGTGTFLGTAKFMNIRCRNMIFEQAGGNLVSYNLKVTNAHLVNANRITLGRHDSTQTVVEVFDGASFDVSPNFDLGPNGQKLAYRGANTTGPEINASRVLMGLSVTGPGILNLAGGDLATLGLTFSSGGVIKTGSATLSSQFPWVNPGPGPANGYVDGNLRMQLVPAHAGHNYTFPVGQNAYSSVSVFISSVTGPSALTIKAVDMTLPGLDPTVSASRYWTITEEGSVIASLTFWPHTSDINGNQANYLRWRSNGGTPVVVGGGNIDELTGNWGLGAALAPASVSVSGTVTTSTGQPIRNALMTISGASLPSPITTTTGNFGTYAFQNLPTGGVYLVEVSAKRYRFTPNSQLVAADHDVTNVNFTANPQE